MRFVVRQNSSREDGWISVKFSKSEDWQHKFFVFEEGVLSYADSEYSELTNIPMDQVISFKTDVSKPNLWFKDRVILIIFFFYIDFSW